MEQYLKLFRTQADYKSASEKPQIGHIVDDVVLKEKTDPYNGHEYVDLGLPSGTKWATMNVGATTMYQYGNYYQYGRGADRYQITSGDSEYEGVENPLAESADTASQVWGGEWHTPTKAQFEELTANTTYSFTTMNGTNGAKFTASNGNYIFLPAAGRYSYGRRDSAGSYGCYWSSTPSNNPYTSVYAWDLFFSQTYDNYGVSDSCRYQNGVSIRGVVG